MAELRFRRPDPKGVDPEPRLLPFRGTLTDFADWDTQVEALLLDTETPTPAFVWPEDHSWCVTCDIDPPFASIGAASDAIDQLVANPRVDVVVDPDSEPPYYS